MNHPFLDRFKSIGFILTKSDKTNAGTVTEWSYYPDWLEDKHFTLVLFCSNRKKHWYLLYIHNNSDGSYYDSPFQLTYNERNANYLNSEFDRIFISELRNNQINQILI